MGPTLQYSTSPGMLDCMTDAQCYASNVSTLALEATTATEKGLRCCMKYELLKEPSTLIGLTALAYSYTNNGIPMKVGSYAKTCNYAFPVFITALSLDATYDSKTGIDTATSAYGGYELKAYCDGGAVALAAGSAAIAALVSLY